MAADPFKPLEDAIKPYSTGLLVLGVLVLGICMSIVGIKLGARSATAKRGDGSHIREGIGAAAGVALGGAILGAAVIIVAVASKVGAATPTG